MEIKELILALLDYETDSEIRFHIKAENDDVEKFDVSIDRTYPSSSNKDISLRIELDGMVIISEEDHDNLETKLDVALDKIQELETELESQLEESK